MTRGLLRSCNKRSLLYKKFKNSHTTKAKEKYVKYRNKLKSVLKKAEKSFYHNKYKLLAENIQQTSKLLGNIIKTQSCKNSIDSFSINGIEIRDKNEIANKLNDYFVNIGSQLAALIPAATVNFSTYLKDQYMNSFCLFATDANEIIDIASNLKNKKSAGYDQIPVNVMKSTIYPIAEPISNIINSSLITGTVPEQLKIAKICPIFKGGERDKFINYRPISVLPSFSKIFEKVVYNRIIKYIDSKQILTNCQYGFRKKHSTSMAIIDMYDKLSASLDRNEHSVGIFVDLSKAFDTLDRNILLKKLEHYGIRGVALQWFESYLTNRKQFVFVNDISSSVKDITYDVPQGSILGPLLFILYINDIVNCSDVLQFILFADDTNIFYSNLDCVILEAVLNIELAKLAEWFRANKLSLNVQKIIILLLV